VAWTDFLQLSGGVLAPLLLFGGTWLGVKYSRKTGHESNLTANWDAYGTRMESLYKQHTEWTERQLAERDKRIDHLEERVNVIEGKYRSAVAYIRRLVSQLRAHVAAADIEKPPIDIEPDL